MYGYIYKTTCLITKIIYIGQKKSNKFLGNKYLGSGKILKQAIAKYGPENFVVELIEECTSREHLNEREIYWINKLHARDRGIGYNICTGGTFGCNIWENLSESEKQDLSNRIHVTRKLHYPTESDETRHKKSVALLGHAVSDVTKQKISESKKEFYNTDNGKVLKQKLSDKYQGHEPWNKGKKMSEEYCEISKKSHPKGWYNHTDETKQQISNTLKRKYESGELVQHEGVGKKKCKNLDTGEVFDSLTEAAKKYHISNPNSIVKCSEGKFKTTGGYHWILFE